MPDPNKKMEEMIKQAVSSSKSRDITDYDSALLFDIFDKPPNDPREHFNQVRKTLINMVSRLERQCIIENEEPPPIVDEVYNFISEADLPTVSPEIEDYQQREGRIININRDDRKSKISCIPENFNRTMERITEEQYISLTNKLEVLRGKVQNQLKENVLNWHEEDFIVEVDPCPKKTT